MTEPREIWIAFGFLVGSVFGSFANVCIHRMPRFESVVSPPSHCPVCGRGIAARDNVPILGWLLLRGRCRSCRAPISARYPLVELVVATLFALAVWRWGVTPTAAAACLLAFTSTVLVATDLESRVLPDEITIGGLVVALVVAATLDASSPGGLFRGGFLVESLLGAALGAGILMAIRVGYEKLRGVEGMGLGDVKMIAMIGAVTGPAGVLLALFFGSLSGALLGGAVVARRTVAWSRARALLRRGRADAAATAGGGLVLDEAGRIEAAGGRWLEIPGATDPGEEPRLPVPTGRRLLAFIRLGLRRAARGRSTFTNRLVLDDDGDFFRVLAARFESAGARRLLLLSRADIPFGVFLAIGAVASFAFGRAALAVLFGDLPIPAARLLP